MTLPADVPAGPPPAPPPAPAPGREASRGAGALAWVVAAFALVLIALPLVSILASVPGNLQAASSGASPPVFTEAQLRFIIGFAMVEQIVLPILGLTLLGGYVPFIPSPAYFRTRVREMAARWSPEPAGTSILKGLALTPVLFIYSITAGLIAMAAVEAATGAPLPQLENPFKEVNLPLALGIALVAGVGEELLFRGVLQGTLQRFLGLPVAILLQGILFGLVHGGYGSWVNPIVAGGFGLLAGLIAGRIGLVALMVAHMAYDVIAIAAGVERLAPFAGGFLVLLILFSIGYGIFLLSQRFGSKPAVEADAAPLHDPPPVPLDGFERERPPQADVLERAGYRVCPSCGRYPLLGGLSGGTWRCRVCWYEELAAKPGPLQAGHAAKLERVRAEHDAIVSAVLEREREGTGGGEGVRGDAGQDS